MIAAPKDLTGLKSVLKSATRKAVSEYVEALSECPPGLIAFLVRECWPGEFAVAEAVTSEVEARQQQGEDTK